ncbi:MAG: diaminopimelate epimerase [Bacteroidota bacterium]
MQFNFFKYQGTGNDFIMVDNRGGTFPKDDFDRVALLCDRRFGIGADGLILLEGEEPHFTMGYYNSDGRPGSMCGNGGRCLVAFARDLGLVNREMTFTAVDGDHKASIEGDLVSLQMQDVSQILERPNAVFLDTGSPHHVQLVEDLPRFDVAQEGAKLRYGLYGQSGSNINFVELQGKGSFAVRTYERGVEAETLSCGTGITAVALAMHATNRLPDNNATIKAPGGELKVHFEFRDGTYSEVYLTGPAKLVFKGDMSW